MNTSRLTALKANRFPDAKWGADDKPVMIADGDLVRINDIHAPLRAEVAYVVGVNDKSFPNLCRFLRARALHFYEMRVSDIAPLSEVGGLTQLAIRWNTKLVDLSPLSRLQDLQVLVLEDTPKTFDLSPLASCRALTALEYSGGIWNRNTAASLTPIAQLPMLEELILTNLKVREGGLKPLGKCKRLKSLSVSNQFPTEDYAYLSAALPHVQCDLFASHVKLSEAIDGKDVMVVGNRKPFLSSTDDVTRIEGYQKAFEELRSEFASKLAVWE